MKRIIIEVQSFRKSLNFWIVKKFTKRSSTPAKICKNQELLAESLKLCFTVEDVKRVREVFDLQYKEFTTMEALKFNIELLYRKKIIKIMNRNYPVTSIYDVVHIQRFFRTATYKECDAIMLHINYNQDHYKKRPDGLRIFKQLWTNRKDAIIKTVQNEYKIA